MVSIVRSTVFVLRGGNRELGLFAIGGTGAHPAKAEGQGSESGRSCLGRAVVLRSLGNQESPGSGIHRAVIGLSRSLECIVHTPGSAAIGCVPDAAVVSSDQGGSTGPGERMLVRMNSAGRRGAPLPPSV